jgi:hypothetical protein
MIVSLESTMMLLHVLTLGPLCKSPAITKVWES